MSAIDPAAVSLIVIAKEPLPGVAKTRLIPDLGEEGASRVAEASLTDTLWAVVEAPAARRILVLDGEPGPWLPRVDGREFELIPQRDGGLGDRLAGAFEDSGAAPALLIGMDTPQVTASLLEASIEALSADGVDAVLGPASDGGWWAIGLRDGDPSVFDDVPMSADDTGERQAARLTELGLRFVELEQLRDIDTDRRRRGRRRRDAVDADGRGPAPMNTSEESSAGRPVPPAPGCSALAALLLMAGCGSEETNPPPAEPATSPPPAEKPVGQVITRHSEAEGVIVDGETGLAAVSFRDPNRIELIDVATGRTVKDVRTPDPARHLSLAAPGGPILAPIEYSDELLRIELPSGKTSSVEVGDFPHDAAQAGNGRVFVSDEGGDTISVVKGDAVEVELPSPEQPGGIAVVGRLGRGRRRRGARDRLPRREHAGAGRDRRRRRRPQPRRRRAGRRHGSLLRRRHRRRRDPRLRGR